MPYVFGRREPLARVTTFFLDISKCSRFVFVFAIFTGRGIVCDPATKSINIYVQFSVRYRATRPSGLNAAVEMMALHPPLLP